jgi:DNA-binding winged helix-turn-helix (wHTH) protein
MKALVFADGEVISRDDIAHLIWGENADSKFSSWAIDKNISRLRGSLRTMGFSDETIVTVKRQGYKLHMEE